MVNLNIKAKIQSKWAITHYSYLLKNMPFRTVCGPKKSSNRTLFNTSLQTSRRNSVWMRCKHMRAIRQFSWTFTVDSLPKNNPFPSWGVLLISAFFTLFCTQKNPSWNWINPNSGHYLYFSPTPQCKRSASNVSLRERDSGVINEHYIR